MTPAAEPVVTSSRGWRSPERRPLAALVVTHVISLFSNQLTGIAVPWFVLVLTDSATRTGLTAAVTLLPSIVMAFFGGAVVDRVSARRLAIVSDVLSGMTVALVPVLFSLHLLSFPLLLALMFLGAIFDSPGATARSTMTPRRAERAGTPLERVNAAFGVSQSVSMLIGAAIAGALVSALGPTNVLWFNAGAFAVSALAMCLAVPELGTHPPSGASLRGDIREGVAWLWRHGALRTTIGAALVINAMFAPIAAVVLPYYARATFGSATALGILMSGYGVGSLLGALAYGVIGARIRRRTQMIVSVALITLPVLGMILLPPLGLAWTLQLVIGVGVGLVNPMVRTVIMRATPPPMLGRVSGVFQAGAMVASPVGVLLAGPMLALLDLRGTFAVFSAVLLGVLALIVASRSIRDFDRQEAPPEPPARERAAQAAR